MLTKHAPDIRTSEITDKKLCLNRREFIQAAAGTAVAATTGVLALESVVRAATPAAHGRKLMNIKKSPYSAADPLNSWDQITTYNNYYEFGTEKDDPCELARNF